MGVDLKKKTKKAESEMDMLFEDTLNNTIPVGNKKFCKIRLSLLESDKRYQRSEWKMKQQVKDLISHWDHNLMDPIRVVPHKDEKRFYIVDGEHRVQALKLMNETYVVAEVLQGLSNDEELRLKQEVAIFVGQDKDRYRVTAQQKHRGNIILGVEANIILDRLMKKYDLKYKKVKGDNTNYLRGFTRSLNIAKTDGEQMLDDIFYIIFEAKWNLDSKGLSAEVIDGLYCIYKYHTRDWEEIKQCFIKIFRNMTVDDVRQLAFSNYRNRTRKDRFVLTLEDLLHENMELELEYLKDENIVRMAKKHKMAI